MRRLRNEKDSGTVALIIAILMSSSLVIGMFVIVVDSGVLFSERRVIQNASDASNMALVRECALIGNGAIAGVSSGYSTPVCESPANATEFAQVYANINSPDALTDVTEVCGKSPLNSCGPNPGGIYDCKSVDPKYLKYARVRTATRTTTGTSMVNLFSKILNQSDSGTTVPGCAQSAWGKASFAPIFFPIALPICNYQLNGTVTLRDFVSNDPVVTAGCQIVDLDGVSFSYASPTQGFSLMSGFGCPGVTPMRIINVGDILSIESSLQQVEQGCQGLNPTVDFYNQASTFLGSIFFVPVVTNVICTSTSNNCQGSYKFQVVSFFAFKLLGLKFKKNDIGTPPNGAWPSYCDANSNCVYGTFSRAAVPGADVSTDPNFPAVGAQAIQLLP